MYYAVNQMDDTLRAAAWTDFQKQCIFLFFYFFNRSVFVSVSERER